MKKTLTIITLSIPVVLLILLVRMPSFGQRELSPPECQVKKWDLPVLLKTKNQKAPSPVLVERSPVACCQGDTSCLDQVLFTGENTQLPDKNILLQAIDRSLGYLQTSNADAAYKNYEVPEITRDRVSKSLQRFKKLLLKSKSATELHAAIEREFVLYQSIGKDNKGSVLFTAYYEATLCCKSRSYPRVSLSDL
jgi:membrane-bound lytic murein transglycosylase A